MQKLLPTKVEVVAVLYTYKLVNPTFQHKIQPSELNTVVILTSGLAANNSNIVHYSQHSFIKGNFVHQSQLRSSKPTSQEQGPETRLSKGAVKG